MKENLYSNLCQDKVSRHFRMAKEVKDTTQHDLGSYDT